MSEKAVRLQVYLSHQGVCSRRQAMDLVQSGRVAVNGKKVVEPSFPVTEDDAVTVDGQEIRDTGVVYILLNKPAGYVTTKKDPFAKATVLDLLPPQYKGLHPVGRLDKDTEGLLLFTNDGDLTHALTHPRHELEKVYAVVVDGHLRKEHAKKLEEGIVLDGRKTAPAKVKELSWLKEKTKFRITIYEGRKRQIRRMLGELGFKVVSLRRTAQGPLRLGDLAVGQWRELNKTEIEKLIKIKK